ncbi:hypothetical protein ACIP93_17230 [Streptomyces sp. NPDC088745]|uniref:hypothetical protein n=1 Tax=Streptomyces sp. NPDC088745 TaxID=3365884 RepID=UPI003824E79D
MIVRPRCGPWAGRTSLRRKIAALAGATALLVVTAVGVLVHLWTAQDIRSRGEARALNTLYGAMDVYCRTGVLTDGAELDPGGLPAALRAPADDRRHRSTTGTSRATSGRASGGPSAPAAPAARSSPSRST